MFKLTKETVIPKGFKLCECGYCDEIIQIYDNQNRYRRFKRGHQSKRENHSQWIGGRKYDGNGYIEILKPGYFKSNKKGYVKEHIFVFQEYYKCCVLSWGHIHHKNEQRDDNRIENLEGMTNRQHTKLHKKKDMGDRICIKCESTITYIKNGYPNWFKFENGFLCKKCNDNLKYNLKRFGVYCQSNPKSLSTSTTTDHFAQGRLQ